MELPAEIDTSAPSIARVYDALLGGKDNFEADREVMRRLLASSPGGEQLARRCRACLGRMVRWLVAEAGVDQFLDLGSGLPTAENVHQIAQRINEEAVVVYVDNDPVVAAHGRALLEDNDHTHFLAADLTDPETILTAPIVAEHLDFTRPVAMIQSMTLHFVPDQADAERIMTSYIDRLTSGSYVAILHFGGLDPDDAVIAEIVATYRTSTGPLTPRTFEQIRALMPGLELVDPGLVPIDDWWPGGPDLEPRPSHARYDIAGLARKPPSF